MKTTLENCWMILPGHTVGFGDIEIEAEMRGYRPAIKVKVPKGVKLKK